jgi:hypothetical protein
MAQIEQVHMPNEIFNELQLNIDNSRQVAFAYSYIYYITYLYRYCKFIDKNGNRVTQERIKEYLGYSPKNKKIDYIIKKGGVLDTIQYTTTTNDYPIRYYFEDNIIFFETISDFKDIFQNTNERNFKVKMPLRAFHRCQDSISDGLLTGTFYEVENTHRIEFEAFERMMESPNLGVVAFYIYGYLRHKNDLHREGYQRSFEKIGIELGMSDKTVRKYIDLLEALGFINVIRMDFKFNADEEDYEANIYNVV